MNIKLDSIPEELRQLPQWVAHKNKKPVNPITGWGASSTDPATWGTFAQAMEFSEREDLSGVSFALAESDPYVAIDLDNCWHERRNEFYPWAREIVQWMDSYTEVSLSGSGLHIVMKGKKPGDRCRNGSYMNLEMYEKARFLAFTGEHFETSPKTIEERTGEITTCTLRIS